MKIDNEKVKEKEKNEHTLACFHTGIEALF